MAKRLIDAEALSKRLKDESINQMEQSPDGRADREARAFADAWKMVKDAPTIDAVVPVHAEWKDHYRSGIKVSKGVVLGCCDMWNERKSDYCPSCGAIMDGEKESEAK